MKILLDTIDVPDIKSDTTVTALKDSLIIINAAFSKRVKSSD